MEVFGTAALLAALFNMSIGIWIFSENSRSKITGRFLLGAFLLAFWAFTEALTKFSPDEQAALLWVKISYVPFFTFPVVLFRMAHRFSRGRWKVPFYSSEILFIGFVVLLFTDNFIQGISNTNYGYEPVYGELFLHVATIYMVVGLIGLILFFSERMKLKDPGRINHTDAMMLGMIITAIFIFFFELISPLLGWELPKIGSVFTIFCTAAFKHVHLQYSTLVYPRIQKSVSTKDAPCGALCSLCSSFLVGRCQSCAMGDTEKKKGCKLYSCTQEHGTTCTTCGHILTCTLYRDYKEECPFSDPVKCLPPSTSYRIESESYREGRSIFRDRIIRGDFGLAVSREHPDVFFKEWDLEEVPIIWLSVKQENKRTVDPTDLAKLAHMIANFMEKVPVSCVLLEGFEYLVLYNSFNTIMKFVYSLHDEVVRHKCRFILSYDPRTFDEDDLAIIEKELNQIPETYLIE